MKINRSWTILLTFLLLVSCSKKDEILNPELETRSYLLGYTPFPYAISNEAVAFSYEKITQESDIVSQHFDDGIPWNEALKDTDFHPNIMADWQFRKTNTPINHKIFLTVTPVNFLRTGLSSYRNAESNLPLPEPWDTIKFNHADVKTAFYNFCKRIIDYFDPHYFAMGIEVNLLMANNKDLWDEYFDLHKTVYLKLKHDYPQLPIFVTQTGMDLIGGFTNPNHADQVTAFNQIMNYSDYLALSSHVFLTSLLADSIPDHIFDEMFTLSSKPLCISETSYPAESFSVYGGTITINGSQEKQKLFFSKLFDKAQKYNCRFIINFVIRDYDQLWQEIGSPDDVYKLWKDTGIYDGDGNARIIKNLWLEKLKLTLKSD